MYKDRTYRTSEGAKIIFSLLLIVVLIYLPIFSSAQELCTGNLGQNIFEDGDFGSGTDIILQMNPGIAPGYQYQPNPPPADGFYTITNNMDLWTYAFPGWILIEDNSDDPLGYFMVVNATFDPGKFYEQTIEDLCENTTYEFSADIINIIGQGEAGFIFPNVAFSLDDVIQFSTGDIPQNERWNKYGFSFTTMPGQTSITLSIRNNAPGGFGNDLGLDNIQFQPCGPKSFINTEETIFLCESENDPADLIADIDTDQFVIQWQVSTDGISWEDIIGENDPVFSHTDFSAGEYYYRYLSSGSITNLQNEKCRIISDLIKIEVIPMDYVDLDTICLGFGYEFGSQNLTEAGIYMEPFVSSIGCDSVVTLTLVALEKEEFELIFETRAPSCFGFSDGSISLVEVPEVFPPYTLYMEGTEQASLFISNISSGTYNFNLVDRYGCEEEGIVVVEDPEEFVITLPADETIQLGTGLDIEGTSNYSNASYLWSPPDYLSCTDCLDNFSFPDNNILYTLTGTNEVGCIASDMIQITVEKDDISIYIPNVFSPNDDGNNDIFTIGALDAIVRSLDIFYIYDRWGNPIFILENVNYDSSIGWDGKFNNQPVQNGVYTYLIQLELIDGEVYNFSGAVSLVR